MTPEEEAEQSAYEERMDFEPFYNYKKSPKKVTELSANFKRYDENGELME